ncbi:hypothetical protein LX81_02039 [Palleronia aestuarii]|uniref:Lipoprotein n=1 Tax=Palleronia aestuarii TaxID=568105 RepID=A0A2W7N7Z4_9RHOB|nr:hypothetical protein [Palleronia aestuarii]PZX16188.1 hypothetical protein LX81_02039 [Palleronia aestuarii]
MSGIRATALCLLLAACVPPGSGPMVTSSGPLAPGEVGTACGLSRTARGVEVAAAPETGRTRWRIHDTAPGSTAPRTQYVTGFTDNCARQVTAALLLFGSPLVHETLRYDPSNRVPYSDLDRAYEQVKGRVCGVGAGVPCPAGRIDALERRTTFVTIYPTFGATTGLVILLIDGGRIVATGSG